MEAAWPLYFPPEQASGPQRVSPVRCSAAAAALHTGQKAGGLLISQAHPESLPLASIPAKMLLVLPARMGNVTRLSLSLGRGCGSKISAREWEEAL